MKIMMAALAGAALLTAPLAASAQDHNWSGGHGGWSGRSGGQTRSAPQAGVQSFSGHSGWSGRSGSEHRGVENRGGFANRGFDARRGGHDGARGGFETRRYAGPAYRGFSNHRSYGYRGYGYRGGSHRWAVGAYLPNLYWGYGIDPYAYGLGAAPFGYHWVLVDDEALLIDDVTGAIVQVVVL